MVRIRLLLVMGLVVLGLPGATMAQPEGQGVTFPALTGEYTVGRAYYGLRDDAREEIFTDEVGDNRRLAVTVYYPAAPAEGDEPDPYVPEWAIQPTALANGVPPVVFEAVQAHSYGGAPAAVVEGGYPVLLFSPGFGVTTTFYTALLEEVASHGYIIAAISHPYSLSVTVFPDGEAVYLNAAGGDLTTDESRERIGTVWTDDTLFTLEQLTLMNSEDPLMIGMMNLEKIGMFGHSFGGATAAQAAYQDERFLAAIDLDGTLFGAAASEGVTQPFMFMRSEIPAPTDEELAALGMTRAEFEQIYADFEAQQQAVLTRSAAGYLVQVTGAAHNTFVSDMGQIAPLLPLFITEELIGSIEPGRAFEIISAYVVAFFDRYVAGTDAPLLDDAEAFPEAVAAARPE